MDPMGYYKLLFEFSGCFCVVVFFRCKKMRDECLFEAPPCPLRMNPWTQCQDELMDLDVMTGKKLGPQQIGNSTKNRKRPFWISRGYLGIPCFYNVSRNSYN